MKLKKISLFFYRCLHLVLRKIAYADDKTVAKIEDISKQLSASSVKPVLLKCNPKNEFFERINIITHAGGGMSGLSYLNCEQGFEYYYALGNRVFEYDVEMTDDEKYALAHNIDSCSLNQYLTRKIDYRFTPMTIEKSLDKLIDNEDIIVIYDCKFGNLKDFALFVKNYVKSEKALSRVVIQVFNESDIEQVRSVFNFQMLYVCMFNADYTEMVNCCIRHKIGAVSISSKAIKERNGWDIFDKMNIYSFVYTVNSVTEFKELKSKGIDGVFSDFLLDEEIKKTSGELI